MRRSETDPSIVRSVMNILVCVTLLSSISLTSARTRLLLSANEERGNSESLFDEEFDNDGLLKPFKVLPPEDVKDFQGGVQTDNITQQINRVADNAKDLQMKENKDASNPAVENEMSEEGKFSQLEPQEEYRRRQVAEGPEPQEEEEQISQKEERASMEPDNVVPETYSLKGIRSILSPDILHALATCGWKDELVIVDNEYPIPVCDKTNCDKHKVLRLDGAPLLLVIEEIMNLWKLDDHNPLAIMLMGDKQDVSETLKFVLSKIITEEEKCGSMDTMDKADLLTYSEFSKRVDKARFIIKTGEVGPWNNILLRKGMITGDCEDHKEDKKNGPTTSNERYLEQEYERKQMNDQMNDQKEDQIIDQMNDQMDRDSREYSSGEETSENDAGMNRAYASEEMDEENFDETGGDSIPDQEKLTGDDLQNTEPREHDSLPEKEEQQYYPEIEALKTEKDNLGEHIENLNLSTKGPYHEKIQTHHQFTDTKYKHNVTIPESLRAPDIRPEEPSVQNQNNEQQQPQMGLAPELEVPPRGVITPQGAAPHGIPVSPEAPHGIPVSPEAPHGIPPSPEAPHRIPLSPEAPQSNPVYSSSFPVTATEQKAPQSLVHPVQPTEEQAKHQGNDAFRNPEYPPGYRRAINLELNGTFSNGQDQQQGEILMNIDALRKYNSNLEKVVKENNGQKDNRVNPQYSGGSEQTRNNPDEISAALKELAGIKDMNLSSIPGLKPN